MTVQIPVDPVVKRYMGNNYLMKRKYVLTTTDVVGDFLIRLLEPPPKWAKIAQFSPERSIWVRIPVGGLYARNNFLRSENARHFNLFVKKLIKHDFFNHMDASVDLNGMQIQRAINEFLYKYEFENTELTFDALQKLYYRHRQKLDGRHIAA